MKKINGRKCVGGGILVGIVFRVLMAIIHFTHVDDIGVTNFIIHQQQITEGNEIDLATEAASFWTYGPLQILFTSNLVNENMSYLFNIFMGRLPSLFCGVVSVLLIYKLMKQINADEVYAMLLTIVLVSLSWENIIYSAQMEPYAMGFLFSVIMVYFVIQRFYEKWSTTILATLLFSIGCYAQYQMFMLVFAIYIVSFLGNMKNKQNLGRVIFTGAVNVVSSIPLLLFLFDTNKLSRSINWNMGKDGMFLYQNPAAGNVLEQVWYAITFFAKNIFICFKYMFLADSFYYIANIMTVVLLLLCGLGIWYVHKDKKYIIFAAFHDFMMIILLVMIIAGKLTLGPSRHILFIVPVWTMLIYFGAVQLKNMPCIGKWYIKILTVSICLSVALFVFSIPKEVSTRRNLVSEQQIQNLVDEYEPGIIYTDPYLNNLFLISVDGYSNLSKATWNGWLQKPDIGSRPQTNDKIILMSRNYTLDDFRDKETERIEGLLKYYNLDTEWSNFDKYSVVYKKEIRTDAEVEYARKYYWNYPNGLFVYVLEYRGDE